MPAKKTIEGTLKNQRITVRFNEIEYEMVCRKAKDAGLTVSEYIREHVIHGKVDIHYHIVADFEKLNHITRELSGIGNNLNQLTRYFHTGGIRSQTMLGELNRCMDEVMSMRREIFELGDEVRSTGRGNAESGR